MGLTKFEKEHFESLAKHLQIQFVENSELNHTDVLESSGLGLVFHVIEDMKDFEFEIYRIPDENIPISKQKEFMRRTDKIAFRAKKLKVDRSEVKIWNAPKESTWRFKIEIPIFESLEQTITW